MKIYIIFAIFLLVSCQAKPLPYKQPLPLLEKQEEVIKSQHKVALLLPLSGKHKELGTAMLDAAELALFTVGEESLSMLILDSGEEKEMVRKAVKQAIAKDVKLIIGPIFSESTKIAAETIADKDIKILSFSNNQKEAHGNVFMLGFSPYDQVRQVIKFAHRSGIENFYLLLQDNEHGKNIHEIIINELEDHANISKAEFYNSSNIANIITDITEAINSDTNNKALFIAEGGERLEHILELLEENNLNRNNLKLLGTGQWDDQKTLNLPLEGGWFATSLTQERQDLEQYFFNKYHYHMPRIATIAYDAVALSSRLAQNNNFDANEIRNSRGFLGMDGVFKFEHDSNLVKRNLSIIEIRNHDFVVIEEPKKNF